MKNNQLQYEKIKEVNFYLDNFKKCLEEKICREKNAQYIIKKSLKEKDILLREIHHRVKNNLQIISSMLMLQQGRSIDVNTIDGFNVAIGRISSIAFVHDLLYRSENISYVNFKLYTSKLVYYLYNIYRKNASVHINIEDEGNVLPIEEAIPCGLVVTELVSNSIKHAFLNKRSGLINISMKSCCAYGYELSISDDGVGFSDNIFCSSSSLGLLLVKELVEGQLNGTLHRIKSIGTCWKIKWISFSSENN